MREKRTDKKVVAGVLGLCVLAAVLAAGGYLYRMLSRPNYVAARSHTLQVYPGDGLDKVLDSLQDSLARPGELARVARLMKLEGELRSGNYVVRPGMSSRSIVNMLRNGLQTPVKVRFNNVRTLEQLAGLLSRQVMLDSLSLLEAFHSQALMDSMGFNAQTLPALFIPDTYEVWWNASSERLMKTFVRAYQRFWNDDRLAAAARLSLSPVEVSILASIVEEETNRTDEWPVIAGLYLNRMRRNMYLQACPTIKYALNDFGLQRILKVHTQVESDYNTYTHLGLPPGPIRIPSVAVLEAVLNAEENNYLYMCAKDDFSGSHYFSSTLAQHNRYAERYHQALNRRRIYH